MESLVIARPFNAHVHLRRGKMLEAVIGYETSVFAASVVMPNDPPITDADETNRYFREMLRAETTHSPTTNFDFLMTIMLTDATTPKIIRGAFGEGAVAGKHYPMGVTTGSAHGVSDHRGLWPAYGEMERLGMPLSIHGEMPGVSPFEAEQAFIPVIEEIAGAFPNLRIIMEHLSTWEAVEFVLRTRNVFGTITAHHLSLTWRDVYEEDRKTIKNPWAFCKPIAKEEDDRLALIQAATSGASDFFFGSDSAPHPPEKKQGDNPAAGIFVPGEVAIAVVAEIFEKAGALPQLEAFLSLSGPKFYGLEPSRETLKLIRQPWQLPATYGNLVPLAAGGTLSWQIAR